MTSAPVTYMAPAKVNLYLHVTGRASAGYHELDSLVMFADFGDEITVYPADELSFTVDGPFAPHLPEEARHAGQESANIVVKAAHGLAALTGCKARGRVHLQKNIPVAAGLGGGSADAAAVIRALAALWDIAPEEHPGFSDFLQSLGADVPVCYRGQAAVMRGIGEDVRPVALPESIPVLLINPLTPCSTAQVFTQRKEGFSSPCRLPQSCSASMVDLVRFLAESTKNDLAVTAQALVPEIKEVLKALEGLDETLFVRMSGSGASCFALFETLSQAQNAATLLTNIRPHWWVQAGCLNRAIKKDGAPS